MAEEIVKVCKVHGGLISEQIKMVYYKNRPNPWIACLTCYKEKNRIRNKLYHTSLAGKESSKKAKVKNLEKNKITAHARYLRLRDQLLKYSREYQIKHKAKANQWKKNSYIKKIENLSDSYIKKLLTWKNILCATDIPQELIEVKRAEVMMIRQLKKLKEGKNSVNINN